MALPNPVGQLVTSPPVTPTFREGDRGALTFIPRPVPVYPAFHNVAGCKV